MGRERGMSTTSINDARDEMHEKTFRAWCNKYLRHRDIKIEANLVDGLKSGVNFILLVEMITGKAITQKYFRQPSMPIHSIENVSIGLACLRAARRDFKIDVEPKSVASGNVKTVLGLVWQMILRFQLLKDGEFQGGGGRGAAMAAAKERVLSWWREQVGDEVPIDSIESFADGRAYCACINRIFPDQAQPYAQLNVRQRLEQSMARAETLLGVLPLLDVDDMLSDDHTLRPDERCVLTYLSEWPTAYELLRSNKSAESEAAEQLAALKAEHEAAERAAAAEAERLRAELARESRRYHDEAAAFEREEAERRKAIAAQGERALEQARRQAEEARRAEETALAEWQQAAAADAEQALIRAQRERAHAEAEAQAALREERERTERALRAAEAEKRALEEHKESELQRLRANLAKRLRRQELEKEAAEKEALMRQQLSKDEFLKWRAEREDELARLRTDRLALEQLAREELARLREENERLKRGNPHQFVRKKFAGPTWCHLCKSLCWPTAMQCTRCKYTIDNKCLRRKPPANCIATDDDDDEAADENDGKLDAGQIQALEQLATLVGAEVQWRPTKLPAAASPESDINEYTHGAWASRYAVLKPGWLLLYADEKLKKLKVMVNLARASVEAFVAPSPKFEDKEPMSLIVRGRKAAHALSFDNEDQRSIWWRVLREQAAAARGQSHEASQRFAIGDKVLVRLWRAPDGDQAGGNVTLSCAADAAPPEILAMFAKKARLDASAAAAFGVFERRAPAAHQTVEDVGAADDRLLADTEPLHFLSGLRESAGKPIVFVVRRK